MFEWFCERRSEHDPVTNKVLGEQAKIIHKKICSDEECPFVASDVWVMEFREHYEIKELEMTAELSANKDVVEPFKKEFFEKINEMELSLEQVYNADEAALYWKRLPSKTLALKKEKSAPGYKISKERVTMTVCCNVTGTHKLPLQIIGKSKNPRSFKNNEDNNNYKNAAIYMQTSNGWQDQESFKKYFEEVFVKNVNEFARDNKLNSKALLILDNASMHKVVETNDDGDIQVIFFPPNVTCLIQPMDQHILPTLTKNYADELLVEKVNRKNVNIQLSDAIKLIDKCWQELPSNIIIRSWQKIYNFDDITQFQYPDIHSVNRLINSTKSLWQKMFSSTNSYFDWLNEIIKDAEITQIILRLILEEE